MMYGLVLLKLLRLPDLIELAFSYEGIDFRSIAH